MDRLQRLLDAAGGPFVVASTALAVLAVGLLAWFVGSLITAKRKFTDGISFESQRRIRLREKDAIYRTFEPLVDDLAPFFPAHSPGNVTLTRLLGLQNQSYWNAGEWWAVKTIEGTLIGLLFAAIVSLSGQFLLIPVVLLPIAAGYPVFMRSDVAGKTKTRLHRMRTRLPFVVDLLSLMMEAGATFPEALNTAIEQTADHPLGAELAEVRREINLGRPRADALEALRQRLDDETFSDLILAVNKGEELGTPLAAILRRQADQMRLRRAQWGEKAAAQATVKIVFPGMVVMLAAMIAVVGPVVLPAIRRVLEGGLN